MSDAKRLLDLEQALARIERKLDLILTKLELEVEAEEAAAPADETTPAYMAEIEELLKQGNKIGAIKVYRYNTGLGLAQAMDEVEALERRRRKKEQ
jgi:ribosomal protein L7/L12